MPTKKEKEKIKKEKAKHLEIEEKILKHYAGISEARDRLKLIDEPHDFREEDRNFARTIREEMKKEFSPFDIVLLARDERRPQTQDYLKEMLDDFSPEIFTNDDPAIIMGYGRLNKHMVAVVGTRRGHVTAERIEFRAGSPIPQGYLNAIEFMIRSHFPIITFGDTQGAYPGRKAEEDNIAAVIAYCIKESLKIPYPIISVIIGEGGSGGVQAIATGDKTLMLENSIYSVITPEGCAAILWRDSKKYAPTTAQSMRITAMDLVKLGIIDKEDIVEEPVGGAHLNYELMFEILKSKLVTSLEELLKLPNDELLERRFQRYRKYGSFINLTEKQFHRHTKVSTGVYKFGKGIIRKIEEIKHRDKDLEKRIEDFGICEGECKKQINYIKLEKNNFVCYSCGYHFPVDADQMVEIIFDKETFSEDYRWMVSTDPLKFRDRIPYWLRLLIAQTKTNRGDAIIIGKGKINGKDCYAAILDSGFLGGSFGSVVGEKICIAGEKALEEKIPYFIVSASGGARMQEGILSLMQMPKTIGVINKLNDADILTISYMTNPTYGGTTASFANVTQKIYAEPEARIGFAGPRVIKETTHEELPLEFQTAESYLKKEKDDILGIDAIIDRNSLKEVISKDLKEYYSNKFM